MIYSTSAKYAVMALIDLAARSGDQPKLIKDISTSTGIPHPFLAKIIQLLVKAGVLNSIKGRGGGLRFTRNPSQIPLGDIVRAVDGQQALLNCMFGLQFCDGTRNCPLHALWGPTRERILDFLETTTIADLADKVKPLQKN